MEEKEVIVQSELGKFDRKTIINLVFILVIIIALGVMIYTTITIVKYKDIILNPLGENMEKFNLEYCSCLDSQNNRLDIYANYSQTKIPSSLRR